ncbi:FecR family protein [Compostibacter hankyongensis]|uniref:FecR family protein n=1 Tax=Compostibacter hankyongensis TaxID=1007089 RepID=A0ABP8FNJ2_9BACT
MEYEDYALEELLMDELFHKWVKDPDAEVSAYWKQWIEDHPGKTDLIRAAKKMVLMFSEPGKQLSDDDRQQIWEGLTQRRIAYEKTLQHKRKEIREKHRIKRFYFLKAAALLMLFIALGGIFRYHLSHSGTIRYATRYGEVKKIWLPDSSVVYLNANSELSFAEPWRKHVPREVFLKGEAYFEVVKKYGRGDGKFIVHAGQIRIEDLSTRFDVNSRNDAVKVVLKEGKVRVFKAGAKEKSMMMDPGDMLVYDTATAGFLRKEVSPDQVISWKDGIQAFKNTTLYEMAQTLKETEGWEFSFSDGRLGNLRFTGGYERNNIDNFLIILSKSFDVKITRKENHIIIKKE